MRLLVVTVHQVLETHADCYKILQPCQALAVQEEIKHVLSSIYILVSYFLMKLCIFWE